MRPPVLPGETVRAVVRTPVQDTDKRQLRHVHRPGQNIVLHFFFEGIRQPECARPFVRDQNL